MKGSVEMPIRSKIDEVILHKGLKKKWLAEQMGISQSYLSQMTKVNDKGFLQNAMSAEYLVKLAHVLGVKVDELVEYEEEDPVNRAGTGDRKKETEANQPEEG